MRWILLLAGVLAAASGVAMSGEPTKIGTLLKVEMHESPAVVDAKVGDVLQLELIYPVVPGQMVSDLKVEFSGQGLTKLATVAVQQRTADGKLIVGAMAIAAFVRTEKAGEVTVKVVPRLEDGKDGQKVEFKVKIAGS